MAIYGDSVIEDTYYEYMYIISIERIYQEFTSFGSVSFFWLANLSAHKSTQIFIRKRTLRMANIVVYR